MPRYVDPQFEGVGHGSDNGEEVIKSSFARPPLGHGDFTDPDGPGNSCMGHRAGATGNPEAVVHVPRDVAAEAFREA